MAHWRKSLTVALLVALLLLLHELSVAACALAVGADGTHGHVEMQVERPLMPDADLLMRSMPAHPDDWLECDAVRVLDRSRSSTAGHAGAPAASRLAVTIASLWSVPRIVAGERGVERSDPPGASTMRALLQVFLN